MSVQLHQPDAAALWAEWRHSIDHRFGDYAAAAPPRRALAQRRLLLALELGWKLEEQVLLPALQSADQTTRREDVLAAEKEIGLLRELSWLLNSPGLPVADHDVVIGVLEGIVTLRCVQIERALDYCVWARSIDSAALVKDVEDLLSRWRAELLATGDIEDEDADPVGRPPR